MSIIEVGVVFKIDCAIHLMLVKNLLETLENFPVSGLSDIGSIGRREQPPGKRLQIEGLLAGECGGMKLMGMKEPGKIFAGEIRMIHLFVIGCELKE